MLVLHPPLRTLMRRRLGGCKGEKRKDRRGQAEQRERGEAGECNGEKRFPGPEKESNKRDEPPCIKVQVRKERGEREGERESYVISA